MAVHALMLLRGHDVVRALLAAAPEVPTVAHDGQQADLILEQVVGAITRFDVLSDGRPTLQPTQPRLIARQPR